LHLALSEKSHAISEELGLLVEYAAEDGYTFRESAQSQVERTLLAIGLATGTVVIIGLAFAVLLGLAIGRPLSKMSNIMTALADGDMTVTIAETKRRDEIGKMSKSIVFLKDSMIKAQRLQDEQVAIEERPTKQRRKDMLDIADLFEKDILTVVDSLSGATTHLSTLAGSMTEAVDQTTMSRPPPLMLATARRKICNMSYRPPRNFPLPSGKWAST